MISVAGWKMYFSYQSHFVASLGVSVLPEKKYKYVVVSF